MDMHIIRPHDLKASQTKNLNICEISRTSRSFAYDINPKKILQNKLRLCYLEWKKMNEATLKFLEKMNEATRFEKESSVVYCDAESFAREAYRRVLTHSSVCYTCDVGRTPTYKFLEAAQAKKKTSIFCLLIRRIGVQVWKQTNFFFCPKTILLGDL